MSSAKIGCLAFTLSAVLPLTATAAIPTATCRPTDRPETGISGETTAAERDAGLPLQGAFKCNTDLVGQYQGEGASWQLTAWKNCAYFDQRHTRRRTNPGGLTETHPGTVVVDVSDPTHPVPTTWLTASAMIDPWESLKVNPPGSCSAAASGRSTPDLTERGFLGLRHRRRLQEPGPAMRTSTSRAASATAASGRRTGRPSTSPRCAHPEHRGGQRRQPSAPPRSRAASSPSTCGRRHSRVLRTCPFRCCTTSSSARTATPPTSRCSGIGADRNGMRCSTSATSSSAGPNPEYRVVSRLTWDDGSIGAQNALPVTIAGKPYIVMADEAGGGIFGACATQGKSANGFPRLIDISDPTHPADCRGDPARRRRPSELHRDVHRPDHLEPDHPARRRGLDNVGPGFFAHSCHYCQVDDADDAKILACNCFAAGLRFFDIHDIANINEMAYFKPPAQGTKVLPGSQYANSNSYARFRPATTTGRPPSPASPRIEELTPVTSGPPPRTTGSW